MLQPKLSFSPFAEDVLGDGKTAQVEDNTRHPNMQKENKQNPPV